LLHVSRAGNQRENIVEAVHIQLVLGFFGFKQEGEVKKMADCGIGYLFFQDILNDRLRTCRKGSKIAVFCHYMRKYIVFWSLWLHFFGNKITFEAAGAYFYRKGGTFNFGFYFNQIRLPGPPSAVFGMAYLIAGHGMFSAKITGPRHLISFLEKSIVLRDYQIMKRM
jgi:hypothetical protein